MYRINSNSNSAGFGITVHTPAKAIRQLFLFVLLTLLSISSKGYAAENYIDYKYYEGSWTVLPDFDTLTPVAEGSQETFALTGARADLFAFLYTAKLYIPEAGSYTFFIASDDGSRILIDDALVVDFDGIHGASTRSGSVSLDVGYHDVEVQYFEYTGGQSLAIQWEGPNQARTALQSFLNPDQDDDGIDNAIEGIGDSDGDGTADYLDTDSDGDGILDATEGTVDTDSDGIPNYQDTDSDNDGVSDLIEGSSDTDSDGQSNNLDLDSDNDGILDNHEHGLTSAGATGVTTPNYAAVHATNLRDAGFTLTIAGTDGHEDVTVNAIGMDADFTDGVWTSSIPQGYRLSSFNEITWQFSEQVRARFDFQYTEDGGSETYSLTVDGKTVLSGSPGDQIIEVIGRDFSVVGSSGGIGLYLDVDTHTVDTTTGNDTDLDSVVDRLDLDSDNDGVSDLYESGGFAGISADADGNGTLDLTEATDSQSDGRIDVFGQFIMDENTGWTSSDAARASNTRYFGANNGVSPSAGSTYIHFDSLTASWAHSEFLALGEVFHAGTYKFSVDVLNVGNLGFPSSSFARATSGVTASTAGSPVSSSSMQTPVPASGTSETWTYTLVVAANSPLIGQAIGFEVGVGAPNGNNENVGFDNLHMTVTPLDTDADAVMDYLDLDSDQDGIPDTIEARSTDAYDAHADDGSDNVDTDSDGVLNLFDSAATFGGLHINFVAPVNTDGTDAVDYLDTDSDNDGLLDSLESGLASVTNATYADPDGTVGMPRDSGNTAEMDYRELDSDGDTVPDSIEGSSVDSDNDGIPDYLDADDNGDGVPTIAQAGIGDGSATYPFTSLSAALNAPAGVYWFETAAGTFQGNVDDAEGGGWVTILNYLHLGGTNPAVVALTDRLPLIASSALGTDESASATAWGHTSNALLTSLDPVETRWYAETSAHSRVIHFSTTFGLDYLTTGTGNMVGVNADFTALSGHTALIPANAGSTVGNSGDFALTNFPFYQGAARHWGVRGHGSRWEVDDYPNNSSNDTLHRVWARGDQLTAADLADGDSDSTPNHLEITDTDGDGVPDGLDVDDDNDGILDINEGALITPTGGAISGAWAGRDHTRSINDTSIVSIDDSIGAVNAENQTIFETSATSGWIEFNLPAGANVSGVALWAPGVPFSGGDAPLREFTVTVTYNNGLSWTSHSLFTEVPTALAYPDTAQVFHLGESFENATAIRLNILNGWVNQGESHTNYASSDDVVLPGAYNMTLGEFRAIVDTDGDLVSDKNDLDSDNDGISDLFESGAPSSWIAADTNSDGTVSIAEAEAVLGVGNADADNDGQLDVFGRFIMDENSGWVATDAARVANNSRYQTSNNGIEPTAGSTYIHFDSLNDGWAHSEYRDLGAVFQPGNYKFTVDVSNIGNLGWPANTFAQVTSGVSGAGAGAAVTPTSSTVPEPASATTETWTIYLEIPNGSPLIGQAIGFEVGVGAPTGLNLNAGFDNLKMAVSPLDTDGDALADYLDLDSDNDSIPDTIEASPTMGYSAHADDGSDNIDTDSDGILNKYDSNSMFGGTYSSFTAPENTDAVDTPDYIDFDSDNDGLTDDVESGLSLVTAATYADVDGTAGLPRDTDGDIESDYRDLDSDGDGIDDLTEGSVDTDTDGQPDYIDSDSDDDGVSDFTEGAVDSDGDSVPDFQDSDDSALYDHDGDGISNSQEGLYVCAADVVEVVSTSNGMLVDGSRSTTVNITSPGLVATAGQLAFRMPETSSTTRTIAFSEPVIDVELLFDNLLSTSFLESFTLTFADGSILSNANFSIFPDAIVGNTVVDAFAALHEYSNTRGLKDSSSGNHRLVSSADANGSNLQYSARIRFTDSRVYEASNGITSITFESESPTSSSVNMWLGIKASCVDPLDTDSDGTPNYLDSDSDGDGIDDSVEGTVDTDDDSIPDYLDTDSDNDGTDDVAEGTGDEDGDGIPDYQDNFFDVIQDAVVWFRADEGVSDSGAGVSIWADQSSFGTDVSRNPSAAVSLNEGMPEFNFNASVEFDGSAGSMLAATAANGSPDDETFIAVTRFTGNGSIEGVITYGSKGIFAGGSSAAHQYVLDGNGAGSTSSSNSENLSDTSASLISGFYRAETTTNSSFYTNGALSENYLGAGRIPTGTSTSLEIGGRTLGGIPGRVFQGEIAEVIQISSDVSGLQQQSVIESYLAAKYGISLDQTVPSDYVDSAGVVVWRASDNVGYSSDIFALSRDDLYNLDQRVSKSVNAGSILTIALDADFTSPNRSAARTTAHANDKQFLYLSNNGESTDNITTEVPSNEPALGNNRIAREWRVTKSANFGQATHLSFSGFDNGYYLVSDADGDFSSGATVMGRLSAAGQFPGVMLADGQYLTLVKGLDTDSDGVIDLMDSDDDNDGIPDSVEGSADSDNDGIPNSLDTDSDGDGLSDISEGVGDTDNDGTPDYLDEDSDGDGVPDQTEGADTNIQVSSPSITVAEDSSIALGLLVDSSLLSGGPWPPIEFSASADNGTLSHGGLDPITGTWVVEPEDIASLAFTPASNYSGEATVFTINYSGENDTVSIDVTRVADAPIVSSVDQQGTQRVVADVSNSYSAALVDTDGSENLFVELTVTTGHTISDGVSSFTATAGNNSVDASSWDPSALTYLSDDVGVFTVGVRAVATDTDGFSATPDTAESNTSFDITVLLDTDGDGDADIIDTDDDNDGISDVDEGVADTDGDGTPDSLDTDSDGDGVPDATEGGGDADGDGILDHIDNDTDGDGIPDAAEGSIDSDGDSIPDYLDTDSDGDGLGDAAEGAIDSDNDGILDYLDTDSDGDGINDAVEGSIDTDSDGILDYLDQDSDGDGINDSVEGAVDSDGDGAPDYVDLDADGDGISDSVEGVVDTDSDGQPDYLDTDSDGDGISDADEGTADSDGDGIPDAQDTDANNDGIPDADLGTGDQDGDGVPDYLDDDIDGDGIANISEGAPNPTDDSDGDGIPNYADTDSDNDGIDDAAEGNGDLDGDGIPDYLDGDSDGDGIADINEGSVDSDNDGIPDYADSDSDGDGVPDSAEGSADTDLDGIPDYLDLDVDGDGIPDAVEGFVDSDGDGTADYKDLDSDNDGLGDGAEGTVDSDGDGIADYLDPDSDNDGLLDSEEAAGDTDGDGIADYLDDDSDNDGIPDGVEGNFDSDGDGAPDYLDDDSDGDGIPDILEGAGDADGDLIPDYLDSDSDNDGIPDSVEGAGDFDNDGIPDSIDTDANGDGIPDAALGSGDQDGDGVPDYLDGDIDGDGIANGTEGSVVPAEDSDGDGIPNYADTDSDNDGIADVLEGTGDADGDGIPDAHDTDSDNDGLADSAEGILDSDQDGILDYLDTDSDGDGINDSIETSADTDGDGIPNYLDTDSDNDGIGDAMESSGDADGDGAPDFLDNDSDGDGITDGAEGSNDTDGDGIPDYLDSDSDGDGIPDVIEGSTDSDGDGIPDAQDTDANGDGIPDANLSDGDIDNDGIPDYLDGDIDGDGIPNGSEGALNPAADSDGDGIPNYADSDSDNDGVPDSEEGTGDADGDGLLDAYDPDADNDGIPDGLEGTNDTDGDGVADYLDSDSDNDGIPDSIEGSVDSDGDGIPDSQDSDGNNDGIPDSLLGSGDLDGDGIPDYLDSDIDGDGVSNTEEAQPDATTDTDGDGLPDFIDSDSDNDGVPDSEESRGDTDGDGIPDFADTDADGDGVPDVAEGFGDTDGDGVADFIDLDADNDGIPDVTEGTEDTDRDGVLDIKDLDSDNDGLPDLIEAGGDDVDGDGRVDNYVDNNNDGYDDGMAAVPLPVDNSDSDDLPDYKDLDSDNDGIPDTRESALAALDSNGDGRIDDGVDAQASQQSSDFVGGQLLNDILDEDGDGWADNIPANMIVDTDGDGMPNHQDRDSDGDGINDLIEAGGVDEDGDGEVDGWNDVDADGIPDDIDADQLGTSDSDGDGIADFADADYLNEADADGDGIVDRFDIDPFDEGFARSSTGEPLLSSALPDTDGDGISDVQQPINEQGFIRTGLGGGGSLNPLSLIALWFFAAVVFRCRKVAEFNSLNSVWRKAMQSSGRRSIVAVAVLFSVTGCSTLGFQSENDNPTLAAAVPEQLRVGNHVYVAAGVGTSRLKPDTSEVTTFAVNDRNNAGQQLTLGVDVSRQLSLELHSADLGAAGLSPEGGINYNMHGASALIYAGKNRHNYKRAGFTGYGRVGYGVMQNSAAGNIPYRQEESNHLLVGAGLEYMTTVGLGFRADLVSYEDDAQYAQLAIVYRMGSPRRGQNGVIAESGSDATVKNPPEPLLQAAIAVSNEVNTCEVQASTDSNLYFNTNSVVMSVEGRQLLQAVAQKMRSCDKLTLALSAHTDGTGAPGYNQNLSKQRASVVGQHLLAMGVQATRIRAKAYGETRPVAPNSTEEGRQLNRRVQMRLQ